MINDIPTNTELAEYEGNTWQVTPVRGVKLEDLLNPEYWAHIAYRFRAGDRIIAIPPDRSYFVELFVLAASKNWAKVVLMREVILIEDSEDDKPVDGFVVEFKGKDKWRVLQGNEILSKDHDDKKAAEKWLLAHKKEVR
jgi:hypothetical protein